MRELIKYYTLRSIVQVIVFFLIVLFLFRFNVIASNDKRDSITHEMNGYVKKYGDILYGALSSLTEIKGTFYGVIEPDYEWDCSISDLTLGGGTLNKKQKAEIISEVTNYLVNHNNSRVLMKKIDMRSLSILNFLKLMQYKKSSSEIVYSAMYVNDMTKPLFNNVIESRNFDQKKIVPLDVGPTLTGNEREVIMCKALDMLSVLPEEKVVSYFNELRRTVDQLLKELN